MKSKSKEYETWAEVQGDIVSFGAKWAEWLTVRGPEDIPAMQRDLDAITMKLAETIFTCQALNKRTPTPTPGMIG